MKLCRSTHNATATMLAIGGKDLQTACGHKEGLARSSTGNPPPLHLPKFCGRIRIARFSFDLCIDETERGALPGECSSLRPDSHAC